VHLLAVDPGLDGSLPGSVRWPHAVSAYDRADEFGLLHDHTGPVGASIGAMSDAPTVHILHGPFIDQTTMLYRRIARRHWLVAISQHQQSMGPSNLRWGASTSFLLRTFLNG